MAENASGARHGEYAPGTFGELRRQLEQSGNPWTVDPTVGDDELLPEYPLGGSTEEDAAVVAAQVNPEEDVRKLIAAFPPNDPGLQQRWRDEGLPVDRTAEATTGDRPDGVYGSSQSRHEAGTSAADDGHESTDAS